MADVFLQRTLAGFMPWGADSEAKTKGYKVGGIYRAKIVKPRNGPHHRMCLALLQLTYDNLPEKYEHRWKSFDDFRYGVAIDAGHCMELVSPSGEIFKQARSISFDALDEDEFRAITPNLMNVCAGILEMSAPDLAMQVAEYADQRYGRAA